VTPASVKTLKSVFGPWATSVSPGKGTGNFFKDEKVASPRLMSAIPASDELSRAIESPHEIDIAIFVPAPPPFHTNKFVALHG